MDGNHGICREAYVNGAAVNEHMANVGPILGPAIEQGVIQMTSFVVHGPAEELEVCKPSTEALGCLYSVVTPTDSGLTTLTEFANSTLQTTHSTQNFCIVYPTFTILQPDKVEAACTQMIQLVQDKESNQCLYYGFTQYQQPGGDEDDTTTTTKLVCREAFVDGASVVAHVENVGPVLGKALEDGIIKLDSIHLEGPADQLEVAKSTLDAFGCQYFALVDGAVARFCAMKDNDPKDTSNTATSPDKKDDAAVDTTCCSLL